MHSFNNRPALFHLGKIPIAITEFIILLQVLGMLLTVAAYSKVMGNTPFSAADILSGQLWRLFTYQLFSPPSALWALGLFFFYNFGKQVESTLGRRAYIQLISGSILLPSTAGLFIAQLPFLNASSIFLGNQILSLSIFCAAISMMPNSPIAFLNIPMKWFGLAIVSISLLQFATKSLWLQAAMMTIGIAFAIIFMVKQGVGTSNFGFRQDVLGTTRSKPKRKKPRQERKLKPRSKLISQRNTEVDLILEKISAHGFQSLSQKEKDTLKKASQDEH